MVEIKEGVYRVHVTLGARDVWEASLWRGFDFLGETALAASSRDEALEEAREMAARVDGPCDVTYIPWRF